MSKTKARALGAFVLFVALDAQYDLHRTVDDGSIDTPVEAPLRLRLWNPRAGDPRRRIGDLLTPEDLDLKVSVSQAVQGKNIGATDTDYAFVGYMPQKGYGGTQWRKTKGETNLFDPFRRGEIVALRRGEILGVMSKYPAKCLKKNSWRPFCECGKREGGDGDPTSNADCFHAQCVRRIRFCPPNRHSDPKRSCPTDQTCKTYKDLLEDGCEYTANDAGVIVKKCNARSLERVQGDPKERAELVHRTTQHYLNMCQGVTSNSGWRYNWCTKVAQYWRGRAYQFQTGSGGVLFFNASRPPWQTLRDQNPKGTCTGALAACDSKRDNKAECVALGCTFTPQSKSCTAAYQADPAGNWRGECAQDDDNRPVGNADPSKGLSDEVEPLDSAPVCVGKPELLCLPVSTANPVKSQFPGACLPTHCAPWVKNKHANGGVDVTYDPPWMPTRYTEREKQGTVPDRYSDEKRQEAGTMEIPGAGVDYNRPDIVHEIRYGELVDYDAKAKEFTVVVEKKYDEAEFQYGEEQRESSPGEGYPSGRGRGSPNRRQCPGPGAPAIVDWVCEKVPAWRIFQIWAPANQAGMQPNAHLNDLPGVSQYEDGAGFQDTLAFNRSGRIALFDATHDEVHRVSTVEQLINVSQQRKGVYSEARQHIILEPGTYWLKKPLEFISSRVHISGYQEFSKLIVPVNAWASTQYSDYNSVLNLITDAGLTNTRASLEVRRRAERARGIGLITRGEGHDRTSVHDNQRSAGTMWQSSGGTVVNEWIEFDLGQAYNLTHLFVWNMNQDKVALSRSVKDVRIKTATGATRPANSRSWQQLTPHCEYWDRAACPNPCSEPCPGFTVDAFTLKPGRGVAEMPAQEIRLLGEGTENVRWVRFELRSAYGGAMRQFIGLSEVRFGGRTTYETRPKIIAGHNGPITKVKKNFAVKFSDVILRHGVVDGSGGIINDGTLIMYNTTLESNVSYAWDGASWRSGGVAVYNRGNAFLDLCDLVWDFSATTSPSGHPEHLERKASQGKTSFIGLLARRIGLFKASGGMLYNFNVDENHPDHLHAPAEKGGQCGQIDCSKKIPPSDPTIATPARSALLSIDGCKFEGSALSPRKWDDLGEATPWWCNFEPGQRILKRLRDGLTTGVIDGSEGPPFGSHVNVGGGMERGGSPTAGDMQGGYPSDPSRPNQYKEAVRQYTIGGGPTKRWDAKLNADYRFDIGGFWDVSDLRICRVVDGDSVVLCDDDGEELAIRLTGVATPTAESCQVYYTDITEKAFDPAILRCSGAVMKKRAQLGAMWLSGLLGSLVKVELTQRYMPFGENVGRVTLLEGPYETLSLSEELLRRGFVVRLTPVIL